MKLKTLKDIQEDKIKKMKNEGLIFSHPELMPVRILDLKKEAIKWYHRSDGNKHKFIKQFFNLTDEDLSEPKEEEA